MNFKENILKLVDEGYILMNKHPEKDLWILNYSATAQYEKVWNEYTLMCRGLVVDADFNIVARPFGKFFNIEEHESPSLPDVPYGMKFEAFEKMDGSLGILFNYQGEWITATRGSFTSDQAVWFKEYLDEISGDVLFNYHILDNDYTYLFELIYPENLIVINYNGKEEPVLLSMVMTKTGEEISYDKMYEEYKNNFDIVKRYVSALIDDLPNDTTGNREGYVIRFENGFRVKIKFDEYVRLHRIITNVSNVSIWEYLRDGESFDELLTKVPDEFYNWVKKVVNNLKHKYIFEEKEALRLFWEITVVNKKKSRKDFAYVAKESIYSGILFKLYDGREYSHLIWKMIKPKYSKPFFGGEK